MSNTDDFDDTVRLVLLELKATKPRISFIDFSRAIRDEHNGQVSVMELQASYQKYMGWDARVAPTHDMETGQAIR